MSADTAITMTSMSRYAILGCGSVGHAVAEKLISDEKDVLIIDHDKSRVDALRDQNLDAREHDIRHSDAAEAVSDVDVVLILSSDIDANTTALEKLREHGGDQFVVARASDPVSSDKLTEAGADVVINPSSVIADSALRALESGELEYRARQLTDVIDGTVGQMAIRIHRSPDPDSVASAVALQAIADSRGVESNIVYGGEIGHKENRAFVNLLGINLVNADPQEVDAEYDTIAVIAQKRGGEVNHEVNADIVVDHHEYTHDHNAGFTDIRPNLSSTSTILTKYIQELNLTPDETVATALLYGTRAETMEFKRDTSPADLTAASYLYPFADQDTLEQVESSSMSAETLDVLAEFLEGGRVCVDI